MKWIAYLGRNTFPIMMFHFLMFKIGNAVMVVLGVIPLEQINSFLPPKPNAEAIWILYVAIACCTSIMIWKVLLRRNMLKRVRLK